MDPKGGSVFFYSSWFLIPTKVGRVLVTMIFQVVGPQRFIGFSTDCLGRIDPNWVAKKNAKNKAAGHFGRGWFHKPVFFQELFVNQDFMES